MKKTIKSKKRTLRGETLRALSENDMQNVAGGLPRVIRLPQLVAVEPTKPDSV